MYFGRVRKNVHQVHTVIFMSIVVVGLAAIGHFSSRSAGTTPSSIRSSSHISNSPVVKSVMLEKESGVIVSPDLTEYHVVNAGGHEIDGITAVSKVDGSWYIGTLVGHVEFSADHRHWRDVSSSLPRRKITAIAQSTTKSGSHAAVVGLGGYSSATPNEPGHVFITVNNGHSWINVSGDLPDIPVEKIQFQNIGENHELVVEMQNRWYGLSSQEGHWRFLKESNVWMK